MTQARLDWMRQDEILPRDSHVTKPKEITRLTGQNLAVLNRLRKGTATRRQLGEIALNVTARISDVRAYLRPRGESAEVIEEHENGLTVYGIVKWPDWLERDRYVPEGQ